MSPPAPSRFLVFVLTLGALCGASMGRAAEAGLWTEFARSPSTHPNIPDCSYSGYGYGERPIPDIAGPVHDITRHGARGDGVTDDGPAIRAALEAVDPEVGGVVYFPNGKYHVGQALFVHTNRTVLRGESRDGVEIVFTRPLDRAYGTFNYTAPSGVAITRWSYEGGLIWFAPRERGVTWRPEGVALDSPMDRKAYRFHWLTTGELGPVAAARRGDRTLRVELAPDAEAPRAGDFVLLELIHPSDHSLAKHIAGDGEWAERYKWHGGSGAPWGTGWAKPETLRWPVEVVAWDADNSVATLKQPLRFDVRPEWKPTLHRMGPLLRESGIENLTLRFARAGEWTKAKHHEEEGWNGPYFNNAVHCWLRDVTLVDMDTGPALASAKCVTLSGFTLKASRPELALHHHGTLTRTNSHDNLFVDFRIESRPYHGLNVESQSTGNVWTRGVLEHGTLDSHRRSPFENLRTDLTLVTNDGVHGGNGGPIMGARFVNWNIRVLSGNNYIVGWADLMPSGAIVGLQGVQPEWSRPEGQKLATTGHSACRVECTGEVPEPANLYEAQLRLRLQTPPHP